MNVYICFIFCIPHEDTAKPMNQETYTITGEQYGALLDNITHQIADARMRASLAASQVLVRLY
jgi:hypothetical protein